MITNGATLRMAIPSQNIGPTERPDRKGEAHDGRQANDP